MRRIFAMLGTFLVGAAGWWLGARIGIGTAVVLSAIGNGVGFITAGNYSTTGSATDKNLSQNRSCRGRDKARRRRGAEFTNSK